MGVNDMRGNFMHNINTDIFANSKILDAIAERKPNLSQSTLHTVVKHINNIALHLKFLSRIFSNKQTALQAHGLLSVQKTNVELEHLWQDGDWNVDHQLLYLSGGECAVTDFQLVDQFVKV
jgi:hypothetical protein